MKSKFVLSGRLERPTVNEELGKRVQYYLQMLL